MKKPRSKTLTRTSTPSSGPANHGHEAPRAGRAGATASTTTTSPSSGSRTKAPGCELPRPDRGHESDPHDGERRAAVSAAALTGCRVRGRSETGGRLVAVPPQPPDVAAERLGEHQRGRRPAGFGSPRAAERPTAAITSATPATRSPSCASRAAAEAPAATAAPIPPRGTRSAPDRSASTQPPTDRATSTLSTRMRNASTSPSSLAPSADAVPVRRASQPSTKSSASATDASVTSVATATCSLERGRGQGRDSHRERRARQRHPAGRAEPRRGVAPESARERQRSGSIRWRDRRASRRRRSRPSAQARSGAASVPASPASGPSCLPRSGSGLGRPQRCSRLEHPKDTTVPDMRRFVERP